MVVTRGWVKSWHEINLMSNVKQPCLMSLDKARGALYPWRGANEWPGVNHSGLTRIHLVLRSSQEKWAFRQGLLLVGLQKLSETTLQITDYLFSLPGMLGWLILGHDFSATLLWFSSFCSGKEANQWNVLHLGNSQPSISTAWTFKFTRQKCTYDRSL